MSATNNPSKPSRPGARIARARLYRHTVAPTTFADDEAQATADGYMCGLCLDFAHLDGLGPCPHCEPDAHLEHILATAQAQAATTWAEEHDPEQGWIW